jgi:hypothetical protein
MGERPPAGRLIRPYTMTGGRTGADIPLIALEALITATPAGLKARHQFRWEASEIISLTKREMAMVEVAARIDVPIGVARVVVADLAKKGAVLITDPPTGELTDLDGISYTTLLNKVLDGIRSL